MNMGGVDMVCSWCGQGIAGEPFSRCSSSPLTWGDGRVEVEMTAGWEAVFCCGGCEWNFELDKHLIYGMSRREARKHLVEFHELSPGRPAGYQSNACAEQSARIARVVKSMFCGKLPVNLN